MIADTLIGFVLDAYGYFGMFVGAILCASVAAFLGLGLYSIAATFLGFWKGGK